MTIAVVSALYTKILQDMIHSKEWYVIHFGGKKYMIIKKPKIDNMWTFPKIGEEII